METNTGCARVWEFVLGVLATVCIVMLTGAIGSALGAAISPISYTLGLVAYVGGIVLAIAFRRPFIAIGMLAAVLVPLLVVGACIVIYGYPR